MKYGIEMSERVDEGVAAESGRNAPLSYGALVGWSFENYGKRFVLKLQTLKSTRSGEPDEVDSHYFVMSPHHATLLANSLFQATGQTAPQPRRKGLLRRITGR